MVTGASLELRVGDQTQNTEAEKVDRFPEEFQHTVNK